MPLVYDDEDGSWARQSLGWPAIVRQDPDLIDALFRFCADGKGVPYGSFVRANRVTLRLESKEYKDKCLVFLRGMTAGAALERARRKAKPGIR